MVDQLIKLSPVSLNTLPKRLNVKKKDAFIL